MPDGSWGYDAAYALRAVMGDKVALERINRKEGAMSPAEMRDWIAGASEVQIPPLEDLPDPAGDPRPKAVPEERREAATRGYRETARLMARLVLELVEEDAGQRRGLERGGAHDLYQEVRRRGRLPEVLEKYGIMGFQYGWAANAVRYCLGLPIGPNPAIAAVELHDSGDGGAS